MSATDYEQLLELQQSGDPEAVLDRLIETLRAEKQYHRLFDARLLKRKFELNLPLNRPSSLQDVPQDLRAQVEETYVDAAREVGELLLAGGDIPAAWTYLQVIREPNKVAEAINQMPVEGGGDERFEEIMQIALYQGVNPLKGVQMMLRSHGTCSTITALDQILPNLTQEQRQACAKQMVRTLYDDLLESVRRHVQDRLPTLEPGLSLKELIAGRDWLFEGGGYHVDVSHLNAVVRFARSIDAPAEELDLAQQLADYGSKLDPKLQYGGEPPFDDFYPAHIQFFNIVLGRDVDAALGYFRDKLAHEPDERDRPLLAYVLVDLLIRAKRLDEAVDIAAEYLANLGEDASFSFAELCVEADRMDVLQRVTRERDDPVGFVGALLGISRNALASGSANA